MVRTGSSIGASRDTGATQGRPSAVISQPPSTEAPTAAIAAIKTFPN